MTATATATEPEAGATGPDDAGAAGRRLTLTWFRALLGLGTLAHETNWAFKIYLPRDHASLADYFGAYRLLVPTAAVPDWLACADHWALAALAAAMVVAPGRLRAAAAYAMLPVIALNFLVQGTKPANHLIVLVAAYSIHALYGLFEAARRAGLDRGPDAAARNFAALRFNLMALLISTYAFAATAKLNPGFLDPSRSHAAGFAHLSMYPVHGALRALAPPSWPPAWRWACGVVGIPGTLFAEFAIPIGLAVPRWRRAALALGLLFHAFILSFSAVDFSVTMFALYPFALRPEELREFAARLRAPSRGVLWGSGLLGLYLSLTSLPASLARGRGSLGFIEAYRVPHTFAASYAAFVMARFALDGARARRRARAAGGPP